MEQKIFSIDLSMGQVLYQRIQRIAKIIMKLNMSYFSFDKYSRLFVIGIMGFRVISKTEYRDIVSLKKFSGKIRYLYLWFHRFWGKSYK